MLLNRLRVCRDVNHYYWAHLDGDANDGSVVVPNLIKVAELLSGKALEVHRVDFRAVHISSVLIRWSDGGLILVRADQSDDWVSFCTVKELCHFICDIEEEFQVDPLKSLNQIVEDSADTLLISKSPTEIAEELAEMMALELLYPLENREEDVRLISDKASISEIAKKRKIPSSYLERALNPKYHSAICAVWKSLHALNEPVRPLAK